MEAGGVVVLLGLALVSASLGTGYLSSFNREKLSSFECGFEPMKKESSSFCLRFFLLSLVFMAFDLELVIYLPLLVVQGRCLNLSVLLVFWVFFLILLLGLYHEINEGAIDWWWHCAG